MAPTSSSCEKKYYMPESFVLIPASDMGMLELTCPFCKKAKVVIDVQDAETNALPPKSGVKLAILMQICTKTTICPGDLCSS